MTSAAALARTLSAEPEEPRGQSFAEAARALDACIEGGIPIVDAVSTGVKLLDAGGGLVRGEFLGLIAAPGVGKSMIADRLVVDIIERDPSATALIANLETSTQVRVARLVAGSAVEIGVTGNIARCVPLTPLLMGALQNPETRDRARAALAGLRSRIGERLRFCEELFAAADLADEIRLAAPTVVVIDHMGMLMSPDAGSATENFDAALIEIVSALRDANTAGVLVHELSKAAVTSGSVGMGASRGSARFASLAGMLVGLTRDEAWSPEDPQIWAELVKSRHGPSGQRESLQLFGGLGYANWAGVTESIPQKTKTRRKTADA